jgi:hypothetical protein
MLHQHRPDPLLEELEADRGISGGILAEGCPCNASEQGEAREQFHRVNERLGMEHYGGEVFLEVEMWVCRGNFCLGPEGSRLECLDIFP